MGRLPLTLALNATDQVRDLLDGRVPVEGVDLTCLSFSVEEVFFRFIRHREWDISECSLAKFAAIRSRGGDLVAIPVFTSRVFRHAAIFVRAGGPVGDPGALRGGRIGIPEWTQTATVYVRGILQDDFGVGLADVEWVQGGTNQPGRIDTVPVELPAGVRVVREVERSLNELLVAGELDAVIAAAPLRGMEDGSVVRLFPDPEPVEREFFARTRIFPIMHVVAIRREVHEAHRWVAMELYKAFGEAKARSAQRMLDSNAPFTPVPWAYEHARRVRELLGDDPWPYGVEANRPTLTAFLRWAREQHVVTGDLAPEALFVDEVLEAFRQ